MIDSNHLLLNFNAPTLESTEDMPLDLTSVLATEDDFDVLQLTDEVNPFVLLMLQMNQEHVTPIKLEVGTERQTKEAESLDCQNTVILPSEKPSLPLVEELLPMDLETPEANIQSLEQNVAMTWINSKTFQAPESSRQPKIKEADVKQFAAADKEWLVPKEWLQELEWSDREALNYSASNKALKELITATDPQQEFHLLKDHEMQPVITSRPEMTPLSEAIFVTMKSETSIQLPDSTSINVLPKDSQIVSQINFQPQNIDTPKVAYQLEIPVDISHPKWANQFSEHIVWLGQQQEVKSAHIKLHPEELGPIEISVQVLKDTASISIQSHNHLVRNIVNESIPQLKEMMIEQGINLSEVHVSADSNQRQQAEHHESDEYSLESPNDQETRQQTPIHKGLVDYFA